MPCDQVRRLSVEWSVADAATVGAAFERAGLRDVVVAAGRVRGVTATGGLVTWAKQSARLAMDECDVARGLGDTIKRAYATATVERAAKRFGWQSSSAKVGNKLTLRRR